MTDTVDPPFDPPFGTVLDLRVAGGPVRVYRAGAGGTPVVLLHGAMLDTAHGVWSDVVGPLAERHRVYVVDLPRHGASRPWDGVLDDAFLRRFLGDLLDALALPRVALVGLSLGGAIALGYALDAPDRVTALVAVGPGGIGARRPWQFLTWAALRVPGLARLTSRVLARRPSLIASSMRTHLVAGEDTPGFSTIVELATAEARAKAAHREPALDDWQVHAFGPFAMRVDHLPDLHRLAVPTLWVRGDRDPLVGAAEIEAAHEATPTSRLVTLADAGHIVTHDRPAAFAELAREFPVRDRIGVGDPCGAAAR